MVIVQLNGGLGNQMFQYALGRHISLRLKTTFKIDTHMYGNYKLRDYELGCFNCVENFASENEVREYHLFGRNRHIWMLKRYFLRPWNLFNKLSVVQEKFFHFDADVVNMTGDLYFRGYWQSEKYFSSIEDVIRGDFTLRIPIDKECHNMLDDIQCTESVSVHIRRGDYITNATTNLHHGVMPLEYYMQAMDYIQSIHRNVHYFIFSDDIEWITQYFGGKDNIKIVGSNRINTGPEDLYLMSQCKHNIIANSSFSWWGAWLNVNKNRIVIAPKKWFAIQDRLTKDLYPENWITM